MIFGRKKKDRDETDETPDARVDAVEDDAAADGSDTEDLKATSAVVAGAGTETAEPLAESEDPEAQRWAEFDKSRDWREDGPYDLDEVDLEEDEIDRLDFGSLIITPLNESELRLQVTEDQRQIVSAMLIKNDSALELSVFAAPRSPGMWAEIREQIMIQTASVGGTADCVEGPFGTELVRNVPVQLPDGQRAFQASRTWVAEGPRWLLRGVLYGQAALTDEVDGDVVGPFFDVFCDVIVRRGAEPKPMGDVLALTVPPQLEAAQQQQQAQQQQG